VNSIKKAPTPSGVGVSVKGGEQENELESTLSQLYYTTKLYFILAESVLNKM